jgi:PKD repeat protein
LAQASSGAGAYGAITNASTYSTGALTTATPILAAHFTGFLSYGDRCATAAPAATATQAQCSGKTVADLTATPAAGGTLSWYNVAVGGSALASNTVLATGTYYVAQTIGGCESNRIMVAVTVNAAPTAIITGSNTICQGQSGTLSANTGAGLTYQWQNNGVNIASATNATYSATAAGAYTVIVTNANTCSATSAATNVTLLSKPTVSFTNSIQAGTGSVVNFTNTSSAGTVIWYFGDALNTTSTQSNPTFWYKANGTFSAKLVVTGANGCSDSTAVSIAITGVRTGVKDLAEALKIKVYPNPFSEVVQIELENTTISFHNEDKIMVTNALGQVVYQGVLNQKSISLETQTWSEGIYNIVLLSNGQTIPVKNVVKVAR